MGPFNRPACRFESSSSDGNLRASASLHEVTTILLVILGEGHHNWAVLFPTTTIRDKGIRGSRRLANMRRRRNRNWGGESLELRQVLDATLVFNEVHYNPQGDAPLEFVELYNQMGIDFDISKWRLANAVDFQFAPGTIVPSGGYIVVAQDPQALLAATGYQALGPFTGRLSNNGERLELRDHNERLMDVMEYSDRAPWSIEADGMGPSLAKRERLTSSGEPEKWISSIVMGGTPGRANFSDQSATAQQEVVRTLVDWNDSWRVDSSGQDRGTAWRAVDGPADFGTAANGVFFAGAARRADAIASLVTGVTATASSELSGFTANQVVNGSGLNADGSHVASNGTDTMWLSTGTFPGLPADTNPEITFNLGQERVLESMRIWNYNEVDSANCCLNRGIARTDVLTAGANQQFQLAIDNQTLNKAPGTNSDFSQTISLDGQTAQYVKLDVDTTAGVANFGDSLNFVGLSEVQFKSYPAAGDTSLPIGPRTHYFRKEFDFADDVSRTSLSVSLLVDDGAVIYLNGTEVYRKNLAAGNVAFDTLANGTVTNAALETDLAIPGSLLRAGKNVLAVEVHQASVTDKDMVFGLQLKSTTAPPDQLIPERIMVSINEIGTGDAPGFFVELANRDSQPLNLSGAKLSFENGFTYTLPAGTIVPARGFLNLNGTTLNLPNNSGQWVRLVNAAGTQVLSGDLVRTRLQGRLPDGVGPLLTESVATPGTANQITLHDEIVINEIMYNYRPEAAKPAIPPQYERTTLVPFASPWRFNESGESLPAGWHTTTHAVGGNWKSGTGLIGFETNAVVSPGIGTTMTDPIVSGIVTAYFETEFTVTAAQLADNIQLLLRHIVDDGAVLYLNGTELLRVNMPTGAYDSTTTATASVNNAVSSDPIVVPASLLVAGVNRLSAELHQRSNTSNDILFGAELVIAKPLDNGTPATTYAENDEEWIELYNRSDRAVDLSNWSLARAVDYKFPAGTTLGPGQYLVVARDADALRVKWPEVASRIVGNFEGSLSNNDELIRLLDNVGNPADEVHYFQNGQWNSAGDGKGSSLELRDPTSDNSKGLAWSASDESDRSQWQTYSYRGVASRSAQGPDGQWQEFVLGMLDDGVVLLDDIQVIQDPSGTPVNLIQNGTFESDTIGGPAATWRAIGNHRQSTVVADPDDPENQVWKFAASGATEHMHNHAETTLKAGGQVVAISNGTEYEIRYRAKWITGSNLLNSRLYFNRMARTTPIEQPDRAGTPGAPNSSLIPNLGPVYEGLKHEPVVPDANQPVTVSVDVMDNHQVRTVTLWYSIEANVWNQVPMSNQGGSHYAGSIPGQPAAKIVQFYVEATDNLGATSTFPRAGKNSRALYKVQDGLTSKTALHNLRIVMTEPDAAFMHTDIELMSNEDLGATIIYNESQVFYDAGVRLVGSQRARPFNERLSFSVSFASDDLFRDLYSSLTLDRSESTGYGQREHIYHHGMNHVGGLPTQYQDLMHIITPRTTHTGSSEIQLARYSDIFLDEQYENGSDGQVYEYELTYFPTSARGGVEGRKVPQPDDVRGIPIRYISENKEDYRWGFLNKNNRQEDDYSQLIEFTKFMSLPNADFLTQSANYIDVDQWLRAFALGAHSGHGDNYLSDGSQHNLQIYVRPDGIVELLPHDFDAFFDANRPVVGNDDLRRLIRDPGNAHMFYGHLDDMAKTTFNADYMKRWTDYWKTLMPAQNFGQHLTDLVRRTTNINTQVLRAAPRVDFALTTSPASVDTPSATLAGSGWVNVRELRLAGSSKPLPTRWTAITQWEVDVPLVQGVNQIKLEAYDFQGVKIGEVLTTITSTASNNLAGALRITEVNYHPSDPTAAELAAIAGLSDNSFEFIELANVSNQPINLLGAQFTAGVDLVFSPTTLAPGEVAVVVSQPDAFRLRYGNTVRVIGQWSNQSLNNGGEQITLADPLGTVLASFEYDDVAPWPTAADGSGFTLTLIDPVGVTLDSYKLASSWSSSERVGGSAGQLHREGDLTGDGLRTAADIDRLALAIRASDTQFDLNSSGATDQDDLEHLVQQVFGTVFGDSNLDGRFNSSDLVAIFQIGEYEDSISSNSGWADGDWNGDGDFNSADFVFALQYGGYETAAAALDGLNKKK